MKIPSEGDLGKATLIGVAISIGGNILISLALNIQKLAHSRLEHTPPSSPRLQSTPSERTHLLPAAANPWASSPPSPSLSEAPPLSHLTQHRTHTASFLTSKLWWLGLLLMSLGEVGNFVSYAFAPASVVSPLGAVSLVANWLFAPLLLGEKFRRTDVLGVTLAIIGAGTVVLASRENQQGLDVDGLLDAVKQLPFLIYSAVVAASAVILIVLSELGFDDRFVLIDVGLCSLLGGFTVLSTKAVSSLLSSLLWDALKVPIFYPVLVILVITCVGQLRYLNKALQRFDSKVVVPTQFCLFSLSAIVGSGVLYRDFDDVSPQRFLTFLLGLTTTFLGVFLLVPSSPSSPPSPSPTIPQTPPLLTPPSPSKSPPPLPLPTTTSTPTRMPARLRRSSSTRGLSAGHILLTSTNEVPGLTDVVSIVRSPRARVGSLGGMDEREEEGLGAGSGIRIGGTRGVGARARSGSEGRRESGERRERET